MKKAATIFRTIPLLFLLLSLALSCSEVPNQNEPTSEVEGQNALTVVRNAIARFQANMNAPPYSLDELVEKGYIEKLPALHPQRTFDYDPFTGKVDVGFVKPAVAARSQTAAPRQAHSTAMPVERPVAGSPAFVPTLTPQQQEQAGRQVPNVPTRSELTVYVTKTGKKYHNENCSHLRRSKRAILLSDTVAQGYTPCSRCNPAR